MSRLPVPGSDNASWGTILNDFLSQEHNSNGSLKIRTDGTLTAKANDNAVVHLTGAETIEGTKTFSASPSVPNPSGGNDATNKTYVDGVAIAGAPDATTSTKGIVQLAGVLGGTAASPSLANSVITPQKLAGSPSLSSGQTITWNGSAWAGSTPGSTTPASTRIFDVYEADLSGSVKSIDQIQGAIDDAGNWLAGHTSGHAIVRVHYDNVVPWESTSSRKFLRWPKNCPGLLEIDGMGSTVQFTASGQGILCAYTDTPATPASMTEYITYGDVWLHGFTIDANNTEGQQAVLFGTIHTGVQQIRQSFGKVHLSDNHGFNLIPDRIIGNKHRPFVWFGLKSQANSDTAITVDKVLLEDMSCDGANGYWCGGTLSSDGNEISTVCRFKDIECNRCSHERQSLPTTFQTSVNFHVGSEAVVDKLRVRHFLGRNSCDVGIEINNVVDALVTDSTIYDSYSICFTHNNYSGLLNEELQVTRHENCRAIRDILPADDNDPGDGGHGNCKGFGCGPGGLELNPVTGPNHGPLEYINCWYENTNASHEPSRVAFGAFSFSGAPSRILMRDCGSIQRFTSAIAGNKTPSAIYIDTIRNGLLKLQIDNFKFVVRGTKDAGGGNVYWTGVSISPHDATFAPNAELDINFRNLEIDWDVTGANVGAIRFIEPKTGIMRGYVSNISVRQITGTSNPHILYVASGLTDLSIQDRLMLRDIDLGETSSGSVISYLDADNTNRRNIMLEGYVPPGRTFTAASAVTIGASPHTIEHLDFWPASYSIAGGTVSLVELSINGGSTWTDIGIIAGVVTLRQADQLRITYSNAPTVTKLPIQ